MRLKIEIELKKMGKRWTVLVEPTEFIIPTPIIVMASPEEISESSGNKEGEIPLPPLDIWYDPDNVNIHPMGALPLSYIPIATDFIELTEDPELSTFDPNPKYKFELSSSNAHQEVYYFGEAGEFTMHCIAGAWYLYGKATNEQKKSMFFTQKMEDLFLSHI